MILIKHITNSVTMSLVSQGKKKKDFYGILDISKVTDNWVFWKIVKPKIIGKGKICPKITLVENDKILSQDAENAKTFNEYFINIPILNTQSNQSFSTQPRSLEENTISRIIERYKDHPSINLIKSKNSCSANTFSFTPVSTEEVKKQSNLLTQRKLHKKRYQCFKTKFGLFCISCPKRYQCFHFYFKIP